MAAGWLKFPYFSAFSSQRLSAFLVWWYSHSQNHIYYWLVKIVLGRFQSRALLPQVTLREGQRALALLFSSEQGHPAAKGASVQPGGCSCLGKRCRDLQEDSSMGWDGLVAVSSGSRPTSCATSSHHLVSNTLPRQLLCHPLCRVRC